MSDAKDDFKKNMALDKRKAEFQEKKLIVEERKVQRQLDEIAKAENELAIAKNTSYGKLDRESISKIRDANKAYILAARKPMKFITKTFDRIIPFFRKNVILIGAPTGDGKSTTVANIAFETLKQLKPDGTRCKVLVITNEEKAEDVYNRITCLAKGWSYTNHQDFTDEQVNTFDEWIDKLSSDGSLTVVDNDFKGDIGATTSVEGLCAIFDNLIAAGEYYDAVLIDYYQNFKYSKNDPSMNEYDVQASVAAALDMYKNIYPAPIVMMCQINRPDEAETPFQIRIKGRKVIMDICTCVLEITAERDSYRTRWTIHKSRFNDSVGKDFHTGFNRGRYVPYDTAFMTEVNRRKEQNMQDKLNGSKMKALMGDKKPTGDETKE